jgi:ribonuclease P protein component
VLRTIKSAREIDALFSGGDRSANTYVVVLFAPTPFGRGRLGRVAYIAGKRLGNAVLRNRVKRVLREAVKLSGGPWPGFDVAVIARPKTAQSSPATVSRAIGIAVAQKMPGAGRL